MLVPTPHNSAKKGDIAKTVLMPGDPLRAKYIADTYLKDVICYNEVRGMLGFTGTYKDVKISVQGSGMGIPSMGIYSKELFEGYDVENIIRIGSAGAISDDVNVRDIIVARYVTTDSNYPANLVDEEYIPVSSYKLLKKLSKLDEENNLGLKFGEVFTSDIFYSDKEMLENLREQEILGVEMETAALYTNATVASKNAISILTVSDSPLRGESLSSDERQSSFNKMMEIALELAVKCN